MRSRQKGPGDMLLLAPWRRAPLLLLRRPGVALALAAAAFVATLPAAAAPLFLSSSHSAALHDQIEQECPWVAGLHTRGAVNIDRAGPEPTGTHVAQRAAERAARVVTRPPTGLSEPMVTHWYYSTDSGAPGRPGGPVIVLNRADVAAHVQVREGGEGPGVRLPPRRALAAATRGPAASARVRVAAAGGVPRGATSRT
jgi:putative ABC transport system permease protein